jgi:hypothetical protein
MTLRAVCITFILLLLTLPASAQRSQFQICFQDNNRFSCANAANDTSLSASDRAKAAQKQKELQDSGETWNIVGPIVFIVVISGIVFAWKFVRRNIRDAEFAKLPLDGPMKVNIEEQFTPAGSFNSKQVPCGLKIDVKISQKDWKAIADAGLMKKILFQADGPSGQKYDPENVRDWTVEDLKNITYASFWDSDRMHHAKEELIVSLHNLRAHIDGVREGPKTESFEV